jgi:ADP-heptose:LPS heptosyltransferase
VLRRARGYVSGDTGPLHFAAGLGVPVVGLFATKESLYCAAPIYDEKQSVRSADFSMAGIRPERVFAVLSAALAEIENQ